MKLVFSLLVVCLFIPLLAEPRPVTLILKSGKVVRGELIGKDGQTIQVRDYSGVVLSTRMTAVDKLIEPVPQPQRQAGEPVEKAPAPSLVDIATCAKRTRTGKARVFTLKDLAEMPEVSIVGGAMPDPPAAASNPPAGHDREYWQRRIAALKKEITSLQEKESSALPRCKDAQSAHLTRPKKVNGVMVVDPAAEPAECDRLAAIRKQRADAESRLDDLQMQARHEGAPWSWLE
jgi:hypothetical protein